MIKVVCGIIYKDKNVLICRRSHNKSLGGYWEFPGGKIEDGESQEVALSRELFEELGMKVKIGPHFKTVQHVCEMFTIELIAYTCEYEEATFKMSDHDAFEWVTIGDLKNWRLAPADMPIAEQLVNNKSY